MTLSWSPSRSSNLAGYTVYYGSASGVYTSKVAVGNITNTTLTGFSEGATAFAVVTSSDTLGLESVFSPEVKYTIPLLPPSIVLSAPSNNASYAAPASVSLNASVVANGHTLNKVQFLNGTNLLAESTAAPYSWTWTNVGAGTYSLSARLVYDTSGLLNSAAATVQVTGLPVPWKTADVGPVALSGSGTASSGVFTLKGSGKISGTSDSFRFVYQTLNGNGEIRAQVRSVQNLTTGGDTGVMIRESLSPGSRYVLASIASSSTYQWQNRKTTGSGTTSTNIGTGVLPNTWLRLVRSGVTNTCYRSADGTNWTKMGSVNLTMATNIYFGLAVASGQTNTLNTSSLANIIAIP